jgi:hypothetical protein
MLCVIQNAIWLLRDYDSFFRRESPFFVLLEKFALLLEKW